MPTYDYKCTECNNKFELFQSMTEDPITECPKCKGKVKRLIGPGAGPIFKGSGFYETDYKNRGRSSSSAKSSVSTSPSNSTKIEPKPASAKS